MAGDKKGSSGRLSQEEWNALTPAERTKLLKAWKDKKVTKEAADKKSSSPKKRTTIISPRLAVE